MTVNNSSVAIFVSQAKMQLRQVNENPNRFEITLTVTSSCEVTISLQRSEVNSCACVTSNCILTSNKKSQPLTSSTFIVSSEGHTCPGTDLWPHGCASWPHRITSNPQMNFKAVLIFTDLAQLHFCLAYRNSHWAFIDCHTQVILQLGEDEILIYL